MKAMSQSLYLIVAAVVILVTAIVILAIFFNIIPLATGITEASSICQTEASVSCASFGQMPTTWNVQNRDVSVDGTVSKMSCSQIVKKKTGKECKCNKDKKVLEGCVTTTDN